MELTTKIEKNFDMVDKMADESSAFGEYMDEIHHLFRRCKTQDSAAICIFNYGFACGVRKERRKRNPSTCTDLKSRNVSGNESEIKKITALDGNPKAATGRA